MIQAIMSVLTVKTCYSIFIGNLDIFPFDVSISKLTDSEDYQSVLSTAFWLLIKISVLKILTYIITARPVELTAIISVSAFITYKNNNVSFEGPDIHYHSSSCRTRCDTSDNVFLDLHNCCYTIYKLCTCWNDNAIKIVFYE